MSVREVGEPRKDEELSRVRRPRGLRPEAVPRLAGKACALVGLVDIAAGVLPRFRHSRMYALPEVLPGAFGPFAAALSLCAGMLLLLLAHGLERGRRRAWRAAVLLLPAGAFAQFAHRHSLIGVIVSLALLAPLLRHRDRFASLPEPHSRWRALANLVLMGAGSLALGLVVVSAHPHGLIGDPSLADRITHVLYGLFGFEGPLAYQGTTSRTVAVSLGALGLLTAVSTLFLAVRPERPAVRLSEDDQVRLRALLERHGGGDALGHVAPRRDRAVVFSPSGKAAVTYRVDSGVMLADGDPIGDVAAWPGAIERFMDEARAHAWTPAVIGCSGTGDEVWFRETGLHALEPEDEAVVEAADFSLAGGAMRTVRHRVGRSERAGYETRVRLVRDLGEAELDRVRRAAGDWRGTDGERRFATAPERDGDCLVATAHKTDAEPGPYGDLKAVLRFVPWGADGVAPDLTRLDRSADPGMAELLVVAALLAAPKLGIARVSLNLTMFGPAPARGEKTGAGLVPPARHGLPALLSRWFRLGSSRPFPGLFRPRREPRLDVHRAFGDLPRLGPAALRAEGFVHLDRPLSHPLRRPEITARPCAHAAVERDVRPS